MSSLFLGLTCGRSGSSHHSAIDVKMRGKKSSGNKKKRVRYDILRYSRIEEALMVVFWFCRTMGLVEQR